MEKFFQDVKFEKKPSGYFIIEGKEVGHTLQCCHCGKHFLSVKGSGKIRSFCTRCNKIACGDIPCRVCIPAERKLEYQEALEAFNPLIKESAYTFGNSVKIIQNLLNKFPDIRKYHF